MPRTVVAALFLLHGIIALGQSTSTSDATAISLAAKSAAALTAGNAVSDVTLNGGAISVLGSDYETGTATLKANVAGESRVDLNLNSGARTDVRNLANGFPAGAWSKNGGKSTGYPQHNCWTDAAWFFPALSSLTETANTQFVFQFVGAEQHNGLASQHIRVRQTRSGLSAIQDLSAMDFYLDPTSFLPMSVAFTLHTDTDIKTNIPAIVNFADYRQVNGFQVPFHIQQMLNGSVILDITVTDVAFNTGLPDSSFTLP